MKVARRRLTRKLIALFVAPIAIGFAAFGLVTFRTWRAALLDEAERAVREHAAALRAPLEPLGPRHTESGPNPREVFARIAASETLNGVALYDAQGRALVRSPLFPELPPTLNDEIRRASQPERLIERLGGAESLVRIEPIEREGEGAREVLVIVHSLESINRMIRSAEIRLTLAGLGCALATAALAFWVSRALGRGLGNLVSATERLAAGDLAVGPVEGSRLFELDRVARAFNEMIAALADARARLDRAGEERQRLERRILHAQALAVVGQVASSFAHEIGSPLNTIFGWARVSAADPELAAPIREQFETIAAQCERITRIVQRMLSVARPAEDRKESVSLAEVAREATAFLAPHLASRRVALRLELDDEAPRVLAVRDQLFMMVMNLAINAEQAQPQGGVLRVRVADASEAGDEPRVILEVADAGPGIPAERRAQVFEPFYSTKRDQGGTGLGLPLVAEIARELGGRVKIGDSSEGGALFTVVLPAQPR